MLGAGFDGESREAERSDILLRRLVRPRPRSLQEPSTPGQFPAQHSERWPAGQPL